MEVLSIAEKEQHAVDINAKRGNAAFSRYCVKLPDLIIINIILLLSLWLHHKKGMHIEH